MAIEVDVDEEGFPTSVGNILRDQSNPLDGPAADLPAIMPTNPNVRARKLEVNGVAKAKQQHDLANGLEPTTKKRLHRKQPAKKGTLKSMMLQKRQKEDGPQAQGESKTGGAKGQKVAEMRAMIMRCCDHESKRGLQCQDW